MESTPVQRSIDRWYQRLLRAVLLWFAVQRTGRSGTRRSRQRTPERTWPSTAISSRSRTPAFTKAPSKEDQAMRKEQEDDEEW